MSDSRLRRSVLKQVAVCNNDKTTTVNIELINDSHSHLRGSFEGPQDSPYEGGHFEIAIVMPSDYPFKPPKMKFITKVYHPNICSVSGAISLDILAHHWCPALDLHKTLLSLQSLLCDPNPHDPLDAEVAKVYMSYRKAFEDTARNWTRKYAKRPAQPPMSEDRGESGANSRGESTIASPHMSRGSVVSIMRRKYSY
ncbi:ubiquitin-conjugating enzyme/RWD-like protein [Russula compacta]|nr:ubiquitin-conjugating enzyme/RWD-like protein [Russula compacta]